MASKTPKEVRTAFNVYQLGDQIGQGGAGHVFAAQDENGRPWAVKILDGQHVTTKALKRFKNEYEFCREWRHKNIIHVVGAGRVSIGSIERPFIVMPRYDSSLRELLNNGIAHGEVLPLFSQILDGVEAAHLHGVYHRDLKPANVLHLAAERALVVADFGIAHFQAEALHTEVETATGERLHNDGYAAPEQRQGESVGPGADIYALGLMLNEMFTGKRPVGTQPQTIGSVSPAYAYLDPLVEVMTRQDPDDRPNSIRDIQNELIARGNAFLERQRLDALKQKVVPTTTVSDPLIDNPVGIADAAWSEDVLTITLTVAPNDRWITCYQNIPVTYINGKRPSTYRIKGKTAVVPASEVESELLLRQFRDWLPVANGSYKETVERLAREEEAYHRNQLKDQIQKATKEARVNSRLRDVLGPAGP